VLRSHPPPMTSWRSTAASVNRRSQALRMACHCDFGRELLAQALLHLAPRLGGETSAHLLERGHHRLRIVQGLCQVPPEARLERLGELALLEGDDLREEVWIRLTVAEDAQISATRRRDRILRPFPRDLGERRARLELGVERVDPSAGGELLRLRGPRLESDHQLRHVDLLHGQRLLLLLVAGPQRLLRHGVRGGVIQECIGEDLPAGLREPGRHLRGLLQLATARPLSEQGALDQAVERLLRARGVELHGERQVRPCDRCVADPSDLVLVSAPGHRHHPHQHHRPAHPPSHPPHRVPPRTGAPVDPWLTPPLWGSSDAPPPPQATSAAQSGSAQSVKPSPSSSAPPVHSPFSSIFVMERV